LIGAAQPAHILTPSVTSRGIVNMTALSVAEVQSNETRAGKDPAHLVAI
jgi:malate dehydrogenase (oxaloacetate-decarboxylating)(NADP+)